MASSLDMREGGAGCATGPTTRVARCSTSCLQLRVLHFTRLRAVRPRSTTRHGLGRLVTGPACNHALNSLRGASFLAHDLMFSWGESSSAWPPSTL